MTAEDTPPTCATSEKPHDASAQDKRAGRRYAVSQQRGKHRGRVRYIETNDPGKGCRFL